MNLIDFEVTKIISERRDKVWKLAGYTEKGLKRENTSVGKWWHEYLLGDGVEQTYRYYDCDGEHTDTKIFNLSIGEKPYYIGYVGQR